MRDEDEGFGLILWREGSEGVGISSFVRGWFF